MPSHLYKHLSASKDDPPHRWKTLQTPYIIPLETFVIGLCLSTMGVTSNDLLSSGSNPASKPFYQKPFSSSRRLFYCFEEGGRISPHSRVKFDIAFRAFFKKPVHKYFITRLQVVFAQMPSREDTVNIVL